MVMTMILYISSINLNLKTGTLSTPRLSPGFQTLQSHPSIRSLLHSRLPRKPISSPSLSHALPPDYEHIRVSLLHHRHPLPTVGQALAELRSEETRKKTMVYQHSQLVLATPVWAPLQPPSQSVRVPSSKNIPSGS
ncbi:hypothetical protein Acr_00g0059920 [Actinidia rufa]|uniref:Uncharacterized protein n=1 Tax=Actinidia rufa TaxID=165716 RepID=A0A7J0DPP6_9ERIC|nr:hypothetical protein Acr_00g0059920 [Actinidia rufa]